MIKLNVEIKDDTFSYEYNIGSSKRAGTAPLNEDSLIRFVNLLGDCFRIEQGKYDKIFSEIQAKAYIEKHPEILKEFKK